MELSQLAKILLNRGVVVKIVYSENKHQKFITVFNAKYSDKFGLKGRSDKIVNIIDGEEINIDRIKINFLEYQLLPPGVFLKDLTGDTTLTDSFGQNFLLTDVNYVERIKAYILQERAIFIRFLLDQLEVYNTNNTGLIAASYYLRFNKTAASTIEDIKKEAEKDAISKYYIIKYDNEYILPGLRQIGCTNSVLTTTDIEVINSIKVLWFYEIQKQRQNALIFIKETINNLVGQLNLSEEERQDYINQSEEYIEMISDISTDIFDNITNVKDIINIWPESLHPLPYFAYGN